MWLCDFDKQYLHNDLLGEGLGILLWLNGILPQYEGVYPVSKKTLALRLNKTIKKAPKKGRFKAFRVVGK